MNDSFISIIDLVRSRYPLILELDHNYFNRTRLDIFEREVKDILTDLGFKIYTEIVSLRKKTRLLTYVSELQAIQQTVKVNQVKQLTKSDLDQLSQIKDSNNQSLIKSLSYQLSQLKRKIVAAVELSAMLGDEIDKAQGRVFKQLPRFTKVKSKPALKRVKATEAGYRYPAFAFNLDKKSKGWLIDPETWGLVLEDYQETQVFTDRSPLSVFDLSDPASGKKLEDDIPKEDRVYAWQIEREVTHDFVQEVREGQNQAARDNGIDDFVVITILDDRTCESCCDGFGCADFDGMLVSEVEKMTKGQYSAPPYHFNCATAGHRITTSEGFKNIEDIKVGDMVLTHNNRFMPVERLSKTKAPRTLIIELENGTTLEVTEDHPFLHNDGWTAAKDLHVGCSLILNERVD